MGLFYLLVAQLILDFFSNNRQILGSFHANPHHSLGNSDHSNGYIVSDEDFFADFSRKY